MVAEVIQFDRAATFNATAELAAIRLPEAFWQRPVLAHIRAYALSLTAAPAAVLGVTLLRVLATVPPDVVLPPVVGGVGSLNVFCALVGTSGDGKGAAEDAALTATRSPVEVYTAEVGSGEGIAHQYAHRESAGKGQTEVVRDRDSVLFAVDEVDTLAALGGRQGATLMPTVRSAYSGKTLGFGYADPAKRLPIERHTYRLLMSVGVQPDRCGVLLNDSHGGTPQRFFWLPAVSDELTDTPDATPEPWRLRPMNWRNLIPADPDGFRTLTIPDDLAGMIRNNRVRRNRGEGDTLDGHALFTREKVAAGLAVLDGRPAVTGEDWDLAGMIMDVSDRTRAVAQRALDAEQARADLAGAQRAAARDVIRDAARIAAQPVRVRDRIRGLLEAQPDGMWRADLRRAVAYRDRETFDTELELMINEGALSAEYRNADRQAEPGRWITLVW